MITLERAKGLKVGDVLQFQSPGLYIVNDVIIADNDVYVQLKRPSGELILATKADLLDADLRGSVAPPAPPPTVPEAPAIPIEDATRPLPPIDEPKAPPKRTKK